MGACRFCSLLSEHSDGLPPVPTLCYSPELCAGLSRVLTFVSKTSPAMLDVEGSPVRTGLMDSVARYMYSQLWGGLDSPRAHALLESQLSLQLVQILATSSGA